MPIGMGLQSFVPIMCSWEYYPDHKGLISGLLVCSWGLGAFLFAYLMTMVANPDDLLPTIRSVNSEGDLLFDSHVASRIPQMFQTCLVIQCVLAVVGTLLVTRNSEFTQKNTQLASHLEHDLEFDLVSNQPVAVKKTSLWDMLKTRTFWQLFAMYYCGMFFCVYNSSVYKTNALSHLSDHTLTITGSFGSVANCISAVVMAAVMDKISFKSVYFSTMLLQLVVSASIYQLRTDAFAYTVCVTLTGWCHGVHCSCFPAACVQIFGLEHGGQAFSLINFGAQLSSLTGYLIVNFGSELLSQRAMYMICSFLTFINLIILCFFNVESPPKKTIKIEHRPKGIIKTQCQKSLEL